MKHSTTSLLKFQRLQRRLSETKRGLVGLLELLWHGTATQAPDGDIGRYTNEEIAILVDWEDDPDVLIAALVDTGWLDQSDEHRLVVHDWADHMPNWIRLNARRKAVKSTKKAAAKPGDNGHLENTHERSHERSHEASHERSHDSTRLPVQNDLFCQDVGHEASHERSHEASHEASHERSHDALPNLTIPKNTNTDAAVPADVSVAVDEKPKRQKRRVWVKPTVDEIQAFVEAKALNVDAQDWWDYYEARGWLMHRTPMVDWQAAVRNASRRGWCPRKASAARVKRVDPGLAAINADYMRAKRMRHSPETGGQAPG